MVKDKIRKEIREKLNHQSQTQRLRKSNLIKKKLFRLAEFKRAGLVMFYIATDTEVQTRSMILEARKIGKQIAVPVILEGEKKIVPSLIDDIEQELSVGPFGILRPHSQYIRKVPAEAIDLVVVPGLAFDRQGHRLGRGGGYYDRFLTGLPPRTARVGVAFNFQVYPRLPFLSHDIPVTKVISA